MSELERARKYYEAGKYRKAVSLLWEVPLLEESSLQEAQALLDFARTLGSVTEGSLHDDCEHIARRAEAFLASPPALAGSLLMPDPRECPLCGGAMAPGSYSLEDTALRALVVGYSWQSLCFRPGTREPGEPKRQLLFDGMRRGWLCRDCGASLIICPGGKSGTS